MRFLISFLIAAGLFGQTTVINGPGGVVGSNPASNGLQVWSTSSWATAAFSNIVSLWASGSCSGYLKSDGTCSATTAYTGSAYATAANGQNTITLASIPLSGSWGVYLNGVLMPYSTLSLSGAVITYTGAWTLGDTISVVWQTTNSVPGGITLSTAGAVLTIRGTNFATSGTTIALPSGTVSGDLAVIFLSGGAAQQTLPSGWTSLYHPSVSFWSGGIATKVLNSTDITAGSVSFSSNSIITGLVTMIGAPTVMETQASSGGSNINPVTLTTSGSALQDYTVLYFNSVITNSTDTVNRGTLKQSGNNGTNSGALYAEILTSNGTVSATFSNNASSNQSFTGMVVLESSAQPGTLPEVSPSQVVGLSASATTDTTNASNITSGSLAYPRLPATTCASTNTGPMPCLESHAASNSATLDFTTWYSSAYDEYEIDILNLLPATNNVTLEILMSTNGGNSYDTSAIYNNNELVWLASSSASVSTASQTVGILQTNANSTSGYGLSMRVTFTSPGSTSAYKAFYGTGTSTDAASGLRMIGWNLANFYVNTSAVNAFRILASTGNLASGTVRVYGIAH